MKGRKGDGSINPRRVLTYSSSPLQRATDSGEVQASTEEEITHSSTTQRQTILTNTYAHLTPFNFFQSKKTGIKG
jgi:hypothetical protein